MRAALTLLRVRLRLWRDPAVRPAPVVGAPRGEAADVARAVKRWARFVPGATCLVQAVATQELLARRGHAAEIRLGVTRDGGALRAHAWVEAAGVVLVGGGPGDHAVLGSLRP
ncbi:MAG: lasso peptide biosynthesis B2 protein [Myxococcota bacterium]